MMTRFEELKPERQNVVWACAYNFLRPGTCRHHQPVAWSADRRL